MKSMTCSQKITLGGQLTARVRFDLYSEEREF
nr:MAG TPA: hypothetical protein [Caudoviricetes sp.]